MQPSLVFFSSMALTSKLPSLVPASERLKQTITLISSGYSLKPEIGEGQLTVYPWDGEISEWVVSSARAKDPLFSVAIVQKLTRLPTVLMDRFVASELLLIMLVGRALTTKGGVEYRATCPHCQTVQQLSKLKVPGELGVLGAKANDYPGFDEITLPECGDVIKLRPLLVANLREVSEVRPATISESGANLAASIQSVNGTVAATPTELFQYYLALPPADVTYLRKKSRELSPALDTLVPHTCDSEQCRQPFHYNLGMHYDFFL